MKNLLAFAPLFLVSGCLDFLAPDVPEGYPALELGDGAHGIWKHGDVARDIVARVGVIESGGPSVLIQDEGDPSLALRFPELEEGEYASEGDVSDPLIIETDEDGELWADNFPDAEGVTITIDHFDGRVVAGTFGGNVCSLRDDVLVCEDIVDGKFSAVDDRDLQD
jgi:hypothetical protein